MNQRKRPNILIICSDQQRFDTLGCYGNTFTTTPHTDALAQSGVLFENAYCQSPVCAPSRASFMTGRYPRTTRCRQNGQDIPEDEVLFSKILADNGYTCGLAGKFHLSVCSPAAGVRSERRVDDGFHVFDWAHSGSPNHAPNAYHRWLAGQGVPYRIGQYEDSKFVDEGMPEEYHLSTFCTNKAIEFLRTSQNFEDPWLFVVNYFDPHPAFDPPKAYLEKYLDKLDTLPLPNYVPGELDSKPEIQKLEHETAVNGRRKYFGKVRSYPACDMSEKEHRYIKAAYYAMCDLLDKQVGRLMEALKETGAYEDTIVVYMSDHGELLGDHGMYYKGPFFYDPCIHVPYIFSYPGKFSQGKRVREQVDLMGLAPTLLQAAGLEALLSMQGRSMYDFLCGEGTLQEQDIYCEYYNALPWNQPHVQATMVQDKQFKLVVYHSHHTGELYDRIADPNETVNLWGREEYSAQKQQMLIKLCDQMAWTCDPVPPRKGPW